MLRYFVKGGSSVPSGQPATSALNLTHQYIHNAANYTPESFRPAPVRMFHQHLNCFAWKFLLAARNHALLLRVLYHPSQLGGMNFSPKDFFGP
jgi:hypothetical protein